MGSGGRRSSRGSGRLMTHAGELTAFQGEVAEIFFALPQSEGFAVAGGAGLLACDLIVRPTQDLDLFASAPVSSVAQARDAFLAVLVDRGLAVQVVRDADTFVRMVARRGRYTRRCRLRTRSA